MFKCEKCEVMREALEFERARVKDMSDRLLALASAGAYQAVKFDRNDRDPKEFVGSGDDVFEAFNEWGDKVLVQRKEDA